VLDFNTPSRRQVDVRVCAACAPAGNPLLLAPLDGPPPVGDGRWVETGTLIFFVCAGHAAVMARDRISLESAEVAP
jgi:hypothetical protein